MKNPSTKFISRLTKADLTPPEKHLRMFASQIGLPKICLAAQCRRSGKCCGRHVHCIDDHHEIYIKRRAAIYRPDPDMAIFL